MKITNYSETCLIRHAIGELFCVRMNRVSDYTLQKKKTPKLEKWSNGNENEGHLTQRNRLHGCRIRQVTCLYQRCVEKDLFWYLYSSVVKSSPALSYYVCLCRLISVICMHRSASLYDDCLILSSRSVSVKLSLYSCSFQDYNNSL